MLKKNWVLKQRYSQKQLDKWREEGKDVFLRKLMKILLNTAATVI